MNLQKSPHTRTLVVLGDSIPAGYGLPPAYAWPQQLQQQLQQAYPQFHWRLHNLSIPGDTVADAYVRFDDVRRARPDLLLIALGINDCRRAPDPLTQRRIALFRRHEQTWWGRNPWLRRIGARVHPLPHAERGFGDAEASQVPADAFVDILGWMTDQARAMGALPALMTMSPFAAEKEKDPHFAPCPAYNTHIRDLAREAQAALIEVSFPMPPGSWQADGVHLSARGQAELARRVFQNFRRPPIAPHLGIPTKESNAHMAPSMD